MKIAFISDIHANSLGLQIVLQQFQDADKIFCAGDITGYYPFPNETIALLKEHNITSVLGNHDKYLINGKAPEGANMQVIESVEFTKNIISDGSLEFLKSLPEKLELAIDNKKIFMCHGSPWNYLEERIYPDYSSFEKFDQLDSDIIVLGHTHYPFVRKVNNKTILNPGSCGQPRDYNLLSYAVWGTDSNTFEIKRMEWDIESFKNEAIKAGTNPELFDVFNEKS